MFRHRNVRLLVAGQGLSNIGTFAQIVAQALLVLELTGSGLSLGIVTAAQFLPVLLLGPWSGVVLDRVNLRRLLMLTSVVAAAEAALLGVVTLRGDVTIGWLIGLSLVLGVVSVFDRPAAQALLTELVPADELPNAVGLAGAAQSVGRLGGPAIAGVLYAWKGAGPCFLFNAATYLAVVVAMLALRRREMIPRTPQPRARGQMREGWEFVRRSPLHRTILLANAVVGCLAFNFPQFYSSLVELEFHTNPSVFGAAETLNAVTAVAGGIWLSRRMPALTTRTFSLACLLLGTSLAWSAVSPTVPLFLAGMPFFGAVAVFYMTVAQSLVQGATPPALVGRVMTLYTLGIMGTTPLGGLLMGVLIDEVSPRAAIGLGAVSLFLCAGVVALVHRRPLASTAPAQLAEALAIPT